MIEANEAAFKKRRANPGWKESIQRVRCIGYKITVLYEDDRLGSTLDESVNGDGVESKDVGRHQHLKITKVLEATVDWVNSKRLVRTIDGRLVEDRAPKTETLMEVLENTRG